MATALKCPNPSCPFLFDPSQVPPGAVLTCPRCTMRFTLGASPTAPPPALDFTASKIATQAAAKAPLHQSRGMLVIGLGACVAVAVALGVLIFSGGTKPGPA